MNELRYELQQILHKNLTVYENDIDSMDIQTTDRSQFRVPTRSYIKGFVEISYNPLDDNDEALYDFRELLESGLNAPAEIFNAGFLKNIEIVNCSTDFDHTRYRIITKAELHIGHIELDHFESISDYFNDANISSDIKNKNMTLKTHFDGNLFEI